VGKGSFVSQPALSPAGDLGRFAALQSSHVLVALVVVASGLGAAAAFLPGPWPALLPLVAGGTILSLVTVLALQRRRHLARTAAAAGAVAAFTEHDAVACVTCDADGAIETMNASARTRFGAGIAGPLAALLRDELANPAAILARLQTGAEACGAAREDLLTRSGRLRMAVHRLAGERFLWRMEDLPGGRPGADGGGSVPVLTVGPDGAVRAMTPPMRHILGRQVRSLAEVFPEIAQPCARDSLPARGTSPCILGDSVRILRAADGPVRARVIALEGADGTRDIVVAPIPGAAPSAPEGHGDGGTVASTAPESAPQPAADGVESPTAEAALLDSLPVAVVKIAPDGTLRMANRLARSLLSDGAHPGARLPDLLEGLGRPLSAWLEEAAQGRGLGRPETMRATRAPQETFVQVTLQRMRDGEETVLVAVLSDATELKTLEAQFVQSQKMQAIGQLAGGVAHDFNNLLTAISGHCDLLLLRHAPDDPDYADLVQINQNANRAASLVGQLLAFSRKQNLQLAPVDLRDSLGELTHLLNRLVGEKVRLTLAHDPRLKPIRADKRQLEQVIMNLVVNARDAMPEGGEVRIETEVRRFDDPFRRDRAEVPPGEYVLVRVTDCGVGIPAEILPKVFEPFFSTKGVGEGTGLGLSTAYGIVKQTGGYIFVDSVAGTGTTFTLFLPVHAQPAPAAARGAPASGGAGGAGEPAEGVVLLVEDEAPVRAFAGRALRMRGYTVLEAENAEDALRLLEDPDLKVDVFVTDVIMPGMDGPSWVRQARRTRPAAKVVFMSGYAEESFADAQARIPNSVFLPKPFSLNDLAATVQAQLA